MRGTMSMVSGDLGNCCPNTILGKHDTCHFFAQYFRICPRHGPHSPEKLADLDLPEEIAKGLSKLLNLSKSVSTYRVKIRMYDE